MTKERFLALLLLLVCLTGFGQSTYTVSGVVNEDSGIGAAFANVLLIRAVDSSLVKGTLTEDDGRYILEEIPGGEYRIMSSLVGYQSAYSETFELRANYTVESLVLVQGEQLNEVVVEAQKPLYQQKVDRMVINVESSIVSAGNSALEILERSPGIVVNRQSNSLSMVGKDGVVVMINGKRNYMPTSALVQMLEGMSADNIESIELITTPPANFDAEGNAGYINIVLKKRTDLGLNGSYSVSGGYGRGATTSDNLSFNYRKNKVNLYGNYSFRLDTRDQVLATSRAFSENGNGIFTKTVTDRDPTQRNHNARLGIDIQITEKTIIGALLNTFDNRWSMSAFNESFDLENDLPTGFVELDNSEINHLKHFGANFNLKHNFTEQEFISLDIDYLDYRFDNPTDYTNSFYDGTGAFLREELLRSRKDTPLDTWVGKIDYSNKLSDKLKIEFGAKTTGNDFSNDVSIENLVNGIWEIDPTLTNSSILDEKIYAGYGALEYNFNDKTSLKTGLRYEYTDTLLETDTQGAVVDRQYGEWFPSIFLNQKFSDDLAMNLSYSRRITRPTFNELAPFVIFFDPDTFISGNASLQPAISNTFKYGLNYKSYFLALEYTNENASIARFQERIDEATGRLIFESSNLNYVRTFSIILGLPVKITNWWRTQNNLNYVRQNVSAFYLDEPLDLELGNFSANSTHSFKITSGLSAEVSGFYSGEGFFGYARYDAVYGMNIGLQQKLGNNWGTLKLSVNDALNSISFTGGTNLPDQNLVTRNLFDFSQRTFSLTYSRNFGNTKLASSRNRQTGSEEERRRVN